MLRLPHACHEGQLHGVVLWEKPQKPRSFVTTGVGRQKSPLYSNAQTPSIGLNFEEPAMTLHMSKRLETGTLTVVSY
jgi:hypothetical protein